MRNPFLLGFLALLLMGVAFWILSDRAGSPVLHDEVSSSAVSLEDDGQEDALQSTHLSRENYVPSEAVPVFLMLRAVESRDLVQLEALYSPRIRAKIDEIGWAKYAEQVAAIMDFFQKSLDPDEYAITFTGDRERGVVHLRSRDGRTSKMRVAMDGECWVLDEL